MKKVKTIEIILLFICLFFVTYQSFFAGTVFSYLDEVALSVLFVFELAVCGKKQFSLQRKKIINRVLVFIALWLLMSFIALLFGIVILGSHQTLTEIVTAFINASKIFVLLLTFLLLNIQNAQFDKTVVAFLIFSLPSVIYSIVEYIQYYFLNIHLDGHYDIIDGVWYYRIRGFAYHPVGYGNQLAVMALATLYLMKNKKHPVLKMLLVGLFTLLCYLTRTKYAFAMLIVAYIVLLIMRLGKSVRYAAIVLSVAVLTGVLFLNAIHVINLFNIIFAGEEVTIRYQSIVGSLKYLFTKNPLGGGFGFYSSAGFGEAGFFRIFMDSGILGGILFLAPFLYLLLTSLKKKKITHFSLLLFFFLLSGFLNEIYAIPGIFWVFLFASDVESHTSNKIAETNLQ